MQNQAFLSLIVFLINVTAALGFYASYLTTTSSFFPWPNSSDLRPVKKGPQEHISTIITNDGPTIFGSKTRFSVTVFASSDYYLSFTWGTFIPYHWNNLKTYNYTARLEVDWWRSVGRKYVFIYVDGLKPKTQKWIRIIQNSSSVQVIDYLSINVNIEQNNHLIKDWKINTGVVKLKAHIHDPSGFFEGSVTRYEWIFNDGSSAKVTTLNEIEHVFEAEGLFLIQVSASIKKNGKLYNGKTSVNCNVKAKIDGYILAWKEHDNYPTLPSKEKSLPIGLINFQFKLVDKYKSFVGSTFSYIWNYGDGTVVKGEQNATHEYQRLGKMPVALNVYAKKRNDTYHSLIFKNISIRAPIKDLDVQSHSKLKKGRTVQFNITCSGSSPVSFCWYVTRGSCELPSDVMCSPTRLYHHCRNTINHTFQHTGGYCFNVTVMNTVSFAEKSINIQVDDDDQPNSKKQSHSIAVTILPIIAGLLLFIALFIGVNYRIQHRKRLARKTEVATFDFRSRHHSLQEADVQCSPPYRFCPSLIDCSRGVCPVDDDSEPDHEMDEKRTFLEEESGPTTPKRKVSYYGSIQRILGQNKKINSTLKIAEEEPSPFVARKNLSKSV